MTKLPSGLIRKLAVLPFFLLASTLHAGNLPTCAPGPLSNYMGSSCTFDGFTYSGFAYTGSASGGAVAMPASGIEVTPVKLGLDLTARWSVSGEQTLLSDISFDVAAYGIYEFGLTIGGYATGGKGSVQGWESDGSDQVSVWDMQGNSKPSGVYWLDWNQTSLSLSEVINLKGSGGTASLGSVDDKICSTTPEPASLLLLGSGILGLLGLRKKARQN